MYAGTEKSNKNAKNEDQNTNKYNLEEINKNELMKQANESSDSRIFEFLPSNEDY